METIMKINRFAFVFPSKKRTEEFLKELNALIDKYEKMPKAEEGDCYFTYDLE